MISDNKKSICRFVDENCKDFEAISDSIWDYAELGYKEFKSTKIQLDYMKQQGFEITNPVCGLETAFIAQYGSGSPVIGFLGEHDALESLSQVADAPEKKPIVEGGNGHGCGHNLKGAGSMEAACAMKRFLEEKKLPGTIRFYACPAEEGGGGKVIMAKGGVFNDCDAVFDWHPGTTLRIDEGEGSLAVVTSYFTFHGKSAHASSSPHLGRSAVDAAELMNVGVQFLREHVPSDVRIHSAFVNAGGPKPNVVPDICKIVYAVRAQKLDVLTDVWARVQDVAKGAALMTGTTVDAPEIKCSYSDRVVCPVLSDVLADNMKELTPIHYTDEELQYAKTYQAYGSKPDAKSPIDEDVMLPARNGIRRFGGSTDVNDVSYHAPLAMILVPTWANGTVGHSWCVTAQGKSAIAHKGMHTCAKIMACAALDLLESPELVAKVRQSYLDELGGRVYQSFMPDR